MSDIQSIANRAYLHANKAGFLDYPSLRALKAAVIDKVIGEVEEFKSSKPSNSFNKDSEQSEIADIILVMLSYSALRGYDINTMIRDKMDYNEKREDHK